jgi:dTDP-3-amino-3,4,6-trideoxy-alpha-D-glucose transaminase
VGPTRPFPATAARERGARTVPTAAEGGPGVPFVDLRASTEAIRDALQADIDELLDAGAFVNGPAVESFERAFAAACGRRTAIGTASGLDALTIGLRALGLEEGDGVIVPAMTFIATFEAVVHAGGRVVVVDVGEDDACMDPAAVAAATGTGTRFLLPVHLYGQLADMRALAALAADRGLTILEDACQAHGAERDGFTAGAVGAAAAFSFYPSKNLGAMGDAGALVLDDDQVAATARALREHGQTKTYRSDYVGLTSRLDTLQALVLLRKLPLLASWNAERAWAASFYGDALREVGDLRLPTAVTGAKHVWHVYQVRTRDPEALGAYLGTQGIGTKRHYPEPPHLASAFAELGYPAGSFPVAEAIARETLSLPIFPGITEDQLEAVVGAVQAFFAGG